ncbi:MAG TPA: methyltransferase domain-containing protein [Clostridiales bacterium]|nr:methyltransferase domain-containing protein [Clostridiales bacterium]
MALKKDPIQKKPLRSVQEEAVLSEQESLETLGHAISLIISPQHGFGTDAMLLADFAEPHRNDSVLDLGCGCGIIPLLFLRNGILGDLYGLDIQPTAIEQFKRSLELTAQTEDAADVSKVHPVLADLRSLPPEVPLGHFRVVTMNPPYKPVDTGILSENHADKLARHETTCTLQDACQAASSLLQFGGRFCMCLRPERLADAMVAFRHADLEPKRLRFVQKKADTKPWLFLLEGRRGGKPFLNVLPPLLIQNPDGSNSEELSHIIGEYGETR